jgi:hypothetical protein
MRPQPAARHDKHTEGTIMANVDIAKTLMGFLGSNPQMLTQFLDHPYSTTQQATGADERLSQEDMSQVVTAMAGMAGGKTADMSGLAGLAAGLLTANGGSVHSMVNSLFGSSSQPAVQQQAASASGVDLGALMKLAGGIDMAKLAGSVDLSDGLGMDDVMNAAGALFGR